MRGASASPASLPCSAGSVLYFSMYNLQPGATLSDQYCTSRCTICKQRRPPRFSAVFLWTYNLQKPGSVLLKVQSWADHRDDINCNPYPSAVKWYSEAACELSNHATEHTACMPTRMRDVTNAVTADNNAHPSSHFPSLSIPDLSHSSNLPIHTLPTASCMHFPFACLPSSFMSQSHFLAGCRIIYRSQIPF